MPDWLKRYLTSELDIMAPLWNDSWWDSLMAEADEWIEGNGDWSARYGDWTP